MSAKHKEKKTISKQKLTQSFIRKKYSPNSR